MKAYHDILKTVMTKGSEWTQNRTGIPTKGLPGMYFEHDMAEGFPLVTTKKVPFRAIAVENEFFIKGITDKQWLKDRNVRIWNEWGRPSKVQAALDTEIENNPNMTGEEIAARKNKIAEEERDLGPIYGWQWRHFGGKYKWHLESGRDDPEQNYYTIEPGVDQLANLLHTVKTNPNDRRMIVSAWNPVDIHDMALPPCHYSFHAVVYDGRLNLTWSQRSVDTFLGLPFNIAGYALILLLIAKEAGLKPGILSGNLEDVHVYQNQVEQVEEQLSRTPRDNPTLEIPDQGWNGMLKWSSSGFEKNLIGYHPWPALKKVEVAR